ncbi:MAG: hypothetical protein AAGC67_19995 [Myxococcota bacterium]
MRFTLSQIALLLTLLLATVAVAGGKEDAADAATTPPIESAPPDTEIAAPASPAPAEGDPEAAGEEADD